jgi:NOL1/NOP2/fmu family ribosome biogenesis protein
MQSNAHYLAAYRITNPRVLLEWKMVQSIVKQHIQEPSLIFPEEPYIKLCTPFTTAYKSATVIKLELFTAELAYRKDTFSYSALHFFSHDGTDVLGFNVIPDDLRRIKNLQYTLHQKKNIQFLEPYKPEMFELYIAVCEGVGLTTNQGLVLASIEYNKRIELHEKKHGSYRLGEVDAQIYGHYPRGWRVLSSNPEKKLPSS